MVKLKNNEPRSITLKTGTFYDADSPNESWPISFNMDIKASSNYDASKNITTCTVTYEWWMSVPTGIRLGPWTDWDGSYLDIGGVRHNFKASLQATNNINGSSNKKGIITGERTITIQGDSTGSFEKLPVEWFWGVRAYRKSDNKGAWTHSDDSTHFWNPRGSLEIELPDAPNATPQPINIDSIKISYEYTGSYGVYDVKVSWYKTTPATKYNIVVSSPVDKKSAEIQQQNKDDITHETTCKVVNNGVIDVSITPYNGQNAGPTATKQSNQISWPTVYVKEDKHPLSWKVGRVWIKQDNTWKLCEDEVYTRVEDKWKKAKHI